jgi:HlyD family secretion protein
MKKMVNVFTKAFLFLKTKFKTKKKIFIWGAVGLVVFFLFILPIFLKNNNSDQVLVVQRGDFIQDVSVSGKVVPSSSVDLAFKNIGRVTNIYYSVDDVVKAGTLIAQIDVKDAVKDVRDAEVRLESARLSLQKINIENSSENTGYDLDKAYDDGFAAVSDAFLDLPSVTLGLEDLLNEQVLSENSANLVGKTARVYRDRASDLYYKAEDAFSETRDVFRFLDRNSDKADIENIINETYDTAKLINDAVKSATNYVDYLADQSNDSSGYADFQATLAVYSDTMNGHVSALLNSKTEIKDNKDTSSTSGLDVKTAELKVKEAENNLQDAKNRLADYYIRAPFDGVITKIDAKIGEIASANEPLVSMMGADTFQIESFIPEVNIAKVKTGDKAKVTLDAYGSEVYFDAVVVSIDPAETIRDGVSTYKTKLQFTQKDERVKSGMTANAMITVFSKPDTIVVPGGVVFEKDGKNFVQILKENKSTEDREVVIGESSALGQVEILAGLTEGEQVVFNPVTQ